MTEYTSLEVSKRLAGAGFKEEQDTDKGWFSTPASGECLFYYTSAYCPNDLEHIAYAYRSDTLLAWLMKKDAGKVAEAMGVRTLCENGRYGYVQIDVLDNGEWNVSLFRPIEVRVTASTLPDALGEAVLQVLGVSK